MTASISNPLPSTPHHRVCRRTCHYICLTCRTPTRSRHRWQIGPDRQRLYFCSPACLTLYLLQSGLN